MDVKRGNIYYIAKGGYGFTGSEQEAGRPAVIVSNDVLNSTSPTVEVVYLTTQPKRDMPTHVVIRTTGKVSTALCEQVTTVSVDRIGDLFGTCSAQELSMIDIAITESLQLNTLSRAIENDMSAEQDKELSEANHKITQLESALETYKMLYNSLLEHIMAR